MKYKFAKTNPRAAQDIQAHESIGNYHTKTITDLDEVSDPESLERNEKLKKLAEEYNNIET